MEAVDQFETLDRLPAVCPRCETAFEPIQPDADPTALSETGWVCPRCGWSIVTTFVPPLLADQGDYDIIVPQTANPSADLLKTVAKHLAVGLLEAKRTISENDVRLFSGSALDAYRLRDELRRHGVDHTISPEFPY